MDPKHIARLLRIVASGQTLGPLEQHYLGKYADEIDPPDVYGADDPRDRAVQAEIERMGHT